jgi:hypothetical protein
MIEEEEYSINKMNPRLIKNKLKYLDVKWAECLEEMDLSS